jgi:uncharacterized membrane protein YoaK (UPF0700 family)
VRQDALLIALTFAAGAVDAIAFLALGVLTAVMTGNLVLLGIAVGGGAATRALRSLVSLAAYALGVIVGARVAGRGVEPISSPRIARALVIETVLLAAFAVVWVASGAEPDGARAALLIALSGVVMGIQAAAVQALGSRISTTYVTGMLTTLLGDLSALTGLGRDTERHVAAVLALLAGALVGALVLLTVREAAPVVPLAVIAGVIILAQR